MSSASTSHNKSQSINTLQHRKSGTTVTNPQSTSSHTQTVIEKKTFGMSSLLPFTSGYRRVDAREERDGRISFKWKKFAVAAVVIIGLVWLFGPRERRETVIDSIKAPSWPKPVRPPSHSTPPIEEIDDDIPTKPANRPAAPPHSFEDDPDPLKTIYCTKPYKTDARLVQYALMIDAGSTGSRIHIYKFNNCGPSPSYEYEVFRQTKPGLSAYPKDPHTAAQSLDVLLDEAIKVVPSELQSCTPVAVKATAGLRLLGAEQSTAILRAVRERLEQNYPFSVVEKDGVVIMDGSDEGVYAWITANYLLDTIRADSPSDVHSYAVLDLGGASTQIVFEPDFNEDSMFADGDHKYELTFGGKKRTLYQHSYLGYGLMQARQHIHRLVQFMSTFNNRPSAGGSGEIGNPCLWQGSTRRVELEDRNVTMIGSDVGSYESCNRVVELVMAKDAICQTKPCSFNGVYQPSILETFADGKVLLLSYFYDRLAPFYPDEKTRPPLSVASIASLAREVCAGPKAWDAARWGKDEELRTELEGRPEWCLDLTFMHALLRLGYEFPAERGIRIEKKIEGTELGWCLGATIAIVGGELTCRI